MININIMLDYILRKMVTFLRVNVHPEERTAFDNLVKKLEIDCAEVLAELLMRNASEQGI